MSDAATMMIEELIEHYTEEKSGDEVAAYTDILVDIIHGGKIAGIDMDSVMKTRMSV